MVGQFVEYYSTTRHGTFDGISCTCLVLCMITRTKKMFTWLTPFQAFWQVILSLSQDRGYLSLVCTIYRAFFWFGKGLRFHDVITSYPSFLTSGGLLPQSEYYGAAEDINIISFPIECRISYIGRHHSTNFC